MARDKSLLMADGVDMSAFTAAAHPSTSIDLAAADHQVNAGGRFMLKVSIEESLDSSGAATVDFQFEESDDDTTFTDTDHVTGATGYATFIAGYTVFHVPLPINLKRYVRMNAVVATAALTGGKYSAGIEQLAS